MTAFLLAAWLMLSLASCVRDQRSAAVVLGDRMAETRGLPSGVIYRSGVEAGEEGYLSPTLIGTLYGEGAVTRCFPLLEEYAIYLVSFPEPCEIAVLRCYARSDADRIAEMCLSRREQLRVALAGTPYRARADAAEISVKGRTVVMTVLPVNA